MGESSNENRAVGFVDFAPSDGKHYIGEVIFGSIEFKSIQSEKDERRNGTGSFVAIDERMVPYQMEQIGRGHLVDVRMQELAAVRGRRHSDSRLEQLDIADAWSASIASYLILMDLQHFGQT